MKDIYDNIWCVLLFLGSNNRVMLTGVCVKVFVGSVYKNG